VCDTSNHRISHISIRKESEITMTHQPEEVNSRGGEKRLSTLAMLVDCLIRYEGITSTAALAERTQRSERQIWRAKAELRGVTLTEASLSGTSATLSKVSVSPCQERQCHPDINVSPSRTRIRARFEPPTEVLITKKVKAKGAREVEEIELLEGSTNRLCQKLGQWLSPLGSPDLDTARDLLEGQVNFHGRDKVLQGMLDLEALVASGERVNILKALPAFIRTARVQQKQNDNDGEDFLAILRESEQRRMRLKEATH
jgi:hypothetical protein